MSIINYQDINAHMDNIHFAILKITRDFKSFYTNRKC